MELVFLQAAVPLTKTFAFANGTFATTPYPRVSRLTSFHEHVESLDTLYTVIRKHAQQGHALLGGLLDNPLVNESRRGHKMDAERTWIVFDFDAVEASSADEAIKKYLPKECQNVPYVVQLSASMQRPDVKTFSAHIFMWLEKPATSKQLQQWLEVLNFSQPELSKRLTLTPSGFALHWPLDVTSARPAQLIFIAPPRCIGFQPRFDPSELISKHSGRRALSIPAFDPLSRTTIHTKVNELRERVGLPEREIRTAKFNDFEILLNAERGVIHDVRPAADHFLKLNLNGGDSFGYWIDLRQPHIIGNFKGEPYLKTEEVDPDFYKSLVKQAGRVVASPPLDDGVEVIAFYATNHASQIKIGTYSAPSRELRLDNSTMGAAASWMAAYGAVKIGHLPHYDVVFDPRNDIQYVAGYPTINTYRESDYLYNKVEAPKMLPSVATIPKTIKKIMLSMVGGDIAVLEHFMNWLAYIAQTKQKTGTAWVFHGEEGTGKSLFVNKILRPIFGSQLVQVVQYSLLKERFNDYLENALFVVVEEADMAAVDGRPEMMSKLKHWITEDLVMMESKGMKAVERPNFTNFLFNSNSRTPVVISQSNRRFNVANRQEEKLLLSPNEQVSISQGDELEAFAVILQHWPVNAQRSREIIRTEDGERMHEQTTSINQLIAEAISTGNIDFFLERVPSDQETMSDFYNQTNPVPAFKALLTDIATGKREVLGHEDLFVLFRTLIPDPRFFQNSRTWRERHFKSLGIGDTKPIYDRKLEKVKRGIRPEWRKATHTLPDAKQVTKLQAVK